MLAVSAYPHRFTYGSYRGYIVPGASHLRVTTNACPGRELLMEQQVAIRILAKATVYKATSCRAGYGYVDNRCATGAQGLWITLWTTRALTTALPTATRL